MHHPEVKHTLVIFEQMYQNLPPLIPKEIEEEMRQALEDLKKNHLISLEDTEKTVFTFGKKIWAYWRAFAKFIDMYKKKLGDKFLLAKLPLEIKRSYKGFRDYGGDYHDIYSGAPMLFFNIEERQKLVEALIEVDKDIKNHVSQAILSTERKKYEELIEDFRVILDDMEKGIDDLRLMADNEQEHPELAEEIRAQVRGFEYGLCLLAPHTKHEEVINAKEYFEGRKDDKRFNRC